MKAIYKQIKILTAALLLLTAHSVFAAEPLKRGGDDARLNTLMADIHPSIYMATGETNVYGDVPVVVYADSDNLKRWNTVSANQAESVELIVIRVADAKGESARLTAAQLKNFTALKYIVVLYEYGNPDDTALAQKAEAMVKLPNGSEAQLFWIVSIPQ